MPFAHGIIVIFILFTYVILGSNMRRGVDEVESGEGMRRCQNLPKTECVTNPKQT